MSRVGSDLGGLVMIEVEGMDISVFGGNPPKSERDATVSNREPTD